MKNTKINKDLETPNQFVDEVMEMVKMGFWPNIFPLRYLINLFLPLIANHKVLLVVAFIFSQYKNSLGSIFEKSIRLDPKSCFKLKESSINF